MCKDGLLKHMETEWEVESFRGLLFGDFMNRETKAYTLVPDTDKFQARLSLYCSYLLYILSLAAPRKEIAGGDRWCSI